MLDSDLAMLYGVETKRLNESMKRNQNAKITEISSSALNKLKGKPFTSEMVAEMLASRMKEERVFGKNPEAYKLLKQLYMMVFKEKQMDKLKGK